MGPFPLSRLGLVLAGGAALLSGACAEPVSTFDVAAAVATAQAEKRPVLTLPAGTHRLPSQGLVLSKSKSFTIEGNGATLIATNRGASAIRLIDCDGVTIRNVKIDYDPLPFTQGTVVATNPANRSVEVKLHDGYPGMEVTADRGGAYTDARLQLFDKSAPRLKVGAPDYATAKVESRGERIVTVTFPAYQTGLDQIAVGDRVTLSSRAAEGVTIRHSRGIVFEDVSILSAPNVAVLVRSSEEAGTYRRVRIVPGTPPPGATEPRLISACADGLNVADTRVGPVVEGCEFSYQADDGINLHGPMLPVLKKLDERRFLAVLPWRQNRIDLMTRSGDSLRFLRAPAYTVVGEVPVKEIRSVSEPVAPWMEKVGQIWKMLKINPENVTFYQVTLERPAPLEMTEGLFVEIPALAAPGFLIRDSYFHDHRARGVRLMSGNGQVLNNRFERLKGCAISVGAELAFWREAGWSRNVVISGNTILEVGQGAGILDATSYTPGAISVIGHTDDATAARDQGNENIVIEHNRIDGCSVAGISVTKARRVEVRHNTILQVNRAKSKASGNSILIDGADVNVADNVTDQSR